jgi:hypothetical protein
MTIYALHDWDIALKTKFGSFAIDENKAVDLNKQGYGIHFTPNDFSGDRKKDNITKINYWFADIDEGLKTEQMDKIDKLLLKPSIVVESKRGYHLYWCAVDASIENFRLIQEGIINKIGSDPGLKDPARLMRLPGFYHVKDKDAPFLVKKVFSSEDKYTEKEMMYAFEYNKPISKPTNIEEFKKEGLLDPENWNKLFRLDQIVNGNRNNEFTRIVLWLRDAGINPSEIRSAVFEMNRRISKPLEEQELNNIMRGKI